MSSLDVLMSSLVVALALYLQGLPEIKGPKNQCFEAQNENSNTRILKYFRTARKNLKSYINQTQV